MDKETIYQTILKVRDDISGSIEKDGQVKGTKFSYNYASHNNVVHHVRDACKKHGLLIIPKGLNTIQYTKNDTIASGNFIYQLVNKGGEAIEACIFCAGEDYGDKFAYKLDTGALKYLHIQLFMLATDLDPENPKHDTKSEPAKDKLFTTAEALTEMINNAKSKDKIQELSLKYKSLFELETIKTVANNKHKSFK